MPRYWLDANVVLRFLTGNPEGMARDSKKLMERADTGDITLRVSLLVMAEIYWVLHSYYEFTRTEIHDVLDTFIRARGITVEHEKTIQRGLRLAAEENVDFVDAVLSLRAEEAEETVVTFDEKDFQSLPGDWISPNELETS